jgi:DNA-binding NarL/FixJ family response regulator
MVIHLEHALEPAETWIGRRATGERKQEVIRIVVGDDQRLFRESIAILLGGEPSFSVTGLAGNGLEVLELVRLYRPAVVLMNVCMPQMDGIEATRQIKAAFPDTRVILLASFTTNEHMLEGIAAGAHGYVLKDISAAGLVTTIRAVYNGEQVTVPNIANRMARLLDHQHSERSHHHKLTARELQMLKLLAGGKTAKEIAHALDISDKTVRNHISNIYRKLDIFDRSQVVIYALKNGLVNIYDT